MALLPQIQNRINNNLLLINYQIYMSIFHEVCKKKLFLRHNFENEGHGKKESSTRRKFTGT